MQSGVLRVRSHVANRNEMPISFIVEEVKNSSNAEFELLYIFFS